MDAGPKNRDARDEHRGHHDEHGACHNTTITVNNQPVYLHPGEYSLATIKKLSGVPLADDLDELVDCTLKPLPDNSVLKIRGCEIFVSHVKDGGSS